MTQDEMNFYVSELKREIISHSSGFEGGKKRIYDFAMSGINNTELAAKLKKEYGIGGCSWDCADGTHGWIDYDAKGITITVGSYLDKNNRLTFTWPQVASAVRELINDGVYLDPAPAPAVADNAQLSIFDMMA